MRDLSVIIPVLNEEQVLPLLFKEIGKHSSDWGQYELIFIDDGSVDRSYSLLKQFISTHPGKIIKFSRNFGHQAAISAGLEASSGKAVVIMDADLQDPPVVITSMLELWRQGKKIVYAVRRKRKEHVLKRLLYSLYYRILSYITNISIPLDAGDFCLLDRSVVAVLNSMPERNRFLRGMRAWTGIDAASIEYERSARGAGDSKYGFLKLYRLAFDGIAGFSTLPLTLVAYFGIAVSLLSFGVGIALIIVKLFFSIDVAGWTSLIVSVCFLGGIQLMVMGIIGEYVGRIYIESQRRPLYIVEEEYTSDQ